MIGRKSITVEITSTDFSYMQKFNKMFTTKISQQAQSHKDRLHAKYSDVVLEIEVSILS